MDKKQLEDDQWDENHPDFLYVKKRCSETIDSQLSDDRVETINALWKSINQTEEDKKREEKNARKREIRRFKKLYPGLPVPRKPRTPKQKKPKIENLDVPKKYRKIFTKVVIFC